MNRAAAKRSGTPSRWKRQAWRILSPRPGPDDAARALLFATDLVAVIARWNEKRANETALAIGVGVHYGEVFCGIIGEESRLEFTVLGDTVNVPSRLEGATKAHGVAILDHDVFGSNRSKDMNVIDSSMIEHDVIRKPVPTFRHHALVSQAAWQAAGGPAEGWREVSRRPLSDRREAMPYLTPATLAGPSAPGLHRLRRAPRTPPRCIPTPAMPMEAGRLAFRSGARS